MTGKGGDNAELHVMAMMRDRDSAAALRALGDGMARVRLDIGQGPRAVRASHSHPSPDAILLEIDLDDAETIRRRVTALGDDFPGTPVIVIAAGATVAHTRLLMRLGVADLVSQPIEGPELLSVLTEVRRRAQRLKGPKRSPSRVVAFLKAGGGCGATTLAAQTGVALAARHAQAEPEVCLLDLDLQFGTAALSIDLDERVGLAELLEARGRIDGALMRSVMGHHESGLDVLAAPRALMPLDGLTKDFVGDCLSLARAEYQTAMLDLPLAWTDWTYAALKLCDLIVLVVQLNVSSMRSAQRQLEALGEHGLGDVPLRLVLNRFERTWGARTRRREAEQVLGRRFDFTVANDDRVMREALNRGAPVAKIARWSRVNRDLRRLADGTALALAGGRRAAMARPPTSGRVAMGEAP